MNDKPNVPEAIIPGKKDYSFRADMKVMGWAYVGVLISFTGDVLLHYHNDWHVARKTIIALAPLLPALLWVRSVAGWIRGMDELHRRITLEACLFGTTVTLFLFMALHPLSKAGVFQEMGLREWWLMDWHSWWLKGCLMCWFYTLGHNILIRRYK